MNCHMSMLTFVVVLALTVVASANRLCYSGFGQNFSTTTCSSNVQYCSKVTLAGRVTRSCDNLNYCPKQGETCATESLIGDVCCCASDNCNAAAITTKHFLLGLITLAAGLTACYVHH